MFFNLKNIPVSLIKQQASCAMLGMSSQGLHVLVLQWALRGCELQQQLQLGLMKLKTCLSSNVLA